MHKKREFEMTQFLYAQVEGEYSTLKTPEKVEIVRLKAMMTMSNDCVLNSDQCLTIVRQKYQKEQIKHWLFKIACKFL